MKRGPRRRYQWEEWFGRPQTLLVRGIDYSSSQSSMCQYIRNKASASGVRVRLTDNGDSIVIEVVSEVPHPDTTPVAS